MNIALNITPLLTPTPSFWNPFMQFCAKEGASHFYVSEATYQAQRLQVEDWCRKFRPDFLSDNRLLVGAAALKASPCEALITSNSDLSEPLAKCCSFICAPLPTSPHALEQTLKAYKKHKVNLILSGILPDELPESIGPSLQAFFEKNFFYFPFPMEEPVPQSSENAKTHTLLLHNSSISENALSVEKSPFHENLLSLTLPVFKASENLETIDLDAQDPTCINTIISHFQSQSRIINAAHDPQWIVYLKLLEAHFQHKIILWHPAKASPFHYLAHGLNPLHIKSNDSEKDPVLRNWFQEAFNSPEDQSNHPLLSDTILQEALESFSIEHSWNHLLSKLNASPPLSVKIYAWLANHVYSNKTASPWWTAPDLFKPNKSSCPKTITQRRLNHNFIDAYDHENDAKIKLVFKDVRDNLLFKYTQEFLLYSPTPDWIKHFSLCYHAFDDWLATCDQVASLYHETELKTHGRYSLVAFALLEMALDSPDLSTENPLIQSSERFFEKDLHLDRLNWHFYSQRALLYLIHGDFKKALELIHETYSKKFPPYKIHSMLNFFAKEAQVNEAIEFIRTVYNLTPQHKCYGTSTAISHFQNRWFDIIDLQKRQATQPLAHNCLKLLTVDYECHRVDSICFKMEVYWNLYVDSPTPIEDIMSRMQTSLDSISGLPTYTAYRFWLIGEYEKARYVISLENIDEIKSIQELHEYATTQTLLGSPEKAQAPLDRILSLNSNYFTEEDPTSQRWFLEALASKKRGNSKQSQAFFTKAKKTNCFYPEMNTVLGRV